MSKPSRAGVAEQKGSPHVRHQQPTPGNLKGGFFGQLLGAKVGVGVPAHRGYRGDRHKFGQHAGAPDVAGVHDALHAREDLVQGRIDPTVSVGEHAQPGHVTAPLLLVSVTAPLLLVFRHRPLWWRQYHQSAPHAAPAHGRMLAHAPARAHGPMPGRAARTRGTEGRLRGRIGGRENGLTMTS